jgi:hypothetical protein
MIGRPATRRNRMLSELRSQLTFANVVSLVALFVALGGMAAAIAYAIYLRRGSGE